jgi:hypothetical protein
VWERPRVREVLSGSEEREREENVRGEQRREGDI